MKKEFTPKQEHAHHLSCGNIIETRSTRGDFRVDICSACTRFHGTEADRCRSRVDRFNKKYAERLRLLPDPLATGERGC